MTLVADPPFAESPAEPALVATFGLATHAGRVRSHNEDRGLVLPALGIAAVADGMGGHEDGALASATIVEALASIGLAVSAADLLARVEDRLLRANAALWGANQAQGRISGSTIAILLVFERHFACGWAGDSRIYQIRGGAIAQLTRDHTEARDLVERGILTAAEARTWPRRNVITRAIGVASEPRVEFEIGTVEPDDVFILCSDGLSGHVADAEILSMASGAAPQEACDALVALTLERGATDNVTVAVVSFLAAPRPAPAGAPRLETVLQPRAAPSAVPEAVLPETAAGESG